MEKKLKNYRIVSEEGEALLISREHYHNLLAILDLLANNGAGERPQQQQHQNKR